MIKKIGKGLLIFIAVIFLILLIIPFAFKGKINKIAKEQIHNYVNAEVDFEDLSVSLLRSFPDVSVDLQGLTVINRAPFLGDTLAAVGHTYVDISLMSLLGDTPKINSVGLRDVYADVKVNKDSVANYDIAFPSEEKKEVVTEEASTPFSLDIHEYDLENINVNYVDEVSKMSANVINFNHNGSGDLSQDHVSLDTHTNADAITFKMGDVAYLKDLKLVYDAEVIVDHAKDLKLTFKDNVAKINDLNLAFDGAFEMLEDVYDIDFTLKSEKSEFKSLLSLIPNAYSANFPNIKTTGALDLHGVLKGKYSETSIPALDIVLKTDNASIKYPDAPHKIENIYIDTHITNTTGVLDDLKVEVKNLAFKIANDPFKANATVTKPISNLTVKSEIKGQINLENLKNASHLSESDIDLKGMVKANIAAAFDMNSIEKEQYDQIDSKGSVTIEGVSVASEFTPKPVFVKTATLLFNLKNVSLNKASVISGDSDIELNGALDNVYGYAFSDGILKGSLDVSSKVFKVADFYESDTTVVAETTTSKDTIVSEQFKIMPNVEFIGTVNAKKIMYDNIVLTNFVSKTTVKNQRITFNNANANLFKGGIALDGYVDTKPSPIAYKFDMKLKQVDIASAFNGLDMLKKIAPIVGAFHGRFDTDLDVNGALGNDFMPDLAQLTGDAFANLQVDKLDASKNKFLSLAQNKMNFLNFDKTDLKDLKTKITFKDSKVNVAPFSFNFDGIPVTIEGSHGFDSQMDYKLKLEVPAKFLGKEAQGILAKLSGGDQESTRVPLQVKVGGTITKPTVMPNMKNAVASLAKKTIDKQKNKVKEKVKSEAAKKINDLLGIKKSGSKETDKNAAKEDVKTAGKKLLKGLFGK